MKDYLKPEADFVSLVAEEAITAKGEVEDDVLDGEQDLESSIW